MLNELRLAARRLRSDAWAALGAVLAAALGAGLNTAVFAVAYGVLLRPLPYTHAERLVVVSADARFATVPQWRQGLTSMESLAAYSSDHLTVHGAGDPRVSTVALIDDEFFRTLGSARSTGESGAIVSERLVKQSGRTERELLGAQLTVGDAPLTVVGVAPAAFAFPSEQTDVWMPARAAQAIVFDRSADARRFRLVGRLRPGASLAQVRDEAARVAAQLDPDTRPRFGGAITITTMDEGLTGRVRPALLAFTAAAAIVLLIACANVATILVGRTLGRQRELAVRRALGATLAQLLASILSEAVVITAAGSVLGILLALGALRLLQGWAAGIVPRLGDIHVDWTVLVFASVFTALASFLSAVPAFRAVRRATPALRASAAGANRLDRRTRGALIALQIAAAVVLLAGGGLLTRTIVQLLRVDLGVASRGTVVSTLMLTETTSFTAAARGPVLQELLRRIRALPGVTAAGAGSTMPPENASIEIRVTLVGSEGRRSYSLALAAATPGYLPAIGARLIQGRDFEDGDERRDRPVVIVSESAAKAFLKPGQTIGGELPMPLPGLRTRGRATVVGVVSDIRYLGLDTAAGGTIYLVWNDLPAGQPFLAIRSAAPPATLAPSLRAIMRDIDPRMPMTPVRTLDEVVQRSVADERLRALLGGSVALLAFAVAMVGLAGSLARVVHERRQELAIRAALGASPSRAVRTIVNEGAVLAAIGVIIGLVGALAVGRALRSLLHGVSPYDPATLGGVVALVVLVSLLACYVPARRAALVDPLVLLRSE
jgi:putative ABC transport system permease protein